MVHSRFDEADKWLNAGLNDPRLPGVHLITIYDTMMWLRIYQRDLDKAGLIAESIERLLNETNAVDSFFGLWYVVTKVKWLYRSGRVNEGLAVALAAIPNIERMADRNLLDRMRLLLAEGFARTGETQKSIGLVADVFRGNTDTSPELMAEAMRVSGRLVSIDSPAAAQQYFHDSIQTLDLLGHSAAKTEVEQDEEESLCDKGLSSVRPPTAHVTERIARMVELGAHPSLLAAETVSLIMETGAALCVASQAIALDGRRQTLRFDRAADSPTSVDDHPDVVRISLGTHRDNRYEVATVPTSASAARITILAVERLVASALALANARQLEREQAALWPEQTPERQLGLICASERMLDLVKTLRRVASANITVLLTGETGVGKELFARALHQASTRHDKVFQPFNCASVPREMFDSQLFGHRRGAFTGAIDDSPGVIRAAAGGTLFLDEIGEMALDTQPKLLRFLESGEIMPLGDPRPQLVDVRIVAATNANLDELVAEGRFREDLYYRLNVIRINIPPLRERREEIPALVEHFLDRYGRELQKPQLRVADETLEYLVLYRWPGNVRQLSNEIRRLVALAEPGSVLMPAHLSDTIAASRKTIPTERPALHSTEVLTRVDQPLSAAVEHVERAAIQRAVTLAEGNLVEAAKMLGLSRKGLYLKRARLRMG